MNALHIAGRCALAVVLAVLVAGCTTSTTGSSSSSPETSASEIDTTPPVETTGPESPQPSQNGGPAISVASLPIGGNVDDSDDAQRCATVNWLGPKPIPHDVTVSLDGFGLDPDGVFRFGGDLCPSDEPTCGTSWTWTSNTVDVHCFVPVTQIAESEQTVTLVLSGTVHCASQNSCEGFVNSGLGGSQIKFEAISGVVSGSSGASESSSASSESGSTESSSSSSESNAGS